MKRLFPILVAILSSSGVGAFSRDFEGCPVGNTNLVAGIKGILKADELISAHNIETIAEGLGFRIQDYQFTCRQVGESTWEYTSTDGKLRSRVTVRQAENTFVVSSSLKNIDSAPTLPIDIIEPLHIVFKGPCEAWRHIHLLGGTTDARYPPRVLTKIDRRYQPDQAVRIESHPGGRSSNLHLPLLMSLFSSEEASEGLYCGLEWSGLWYIVFESHGEEECSLTAGVKVNGMTLEPGETLQLPDVHLGFFRGGPAEGSNALREYLYHHVTPKHNGEPVIPSVAYNCWQSASRGRSFHIDLLKKQAERAAEIGIEVFIIDADWFHGGFPMGVGNWDRIDTDRFPAGLEPMAEHVRDLGMDFGLWFEPERAAENSTLLQKHPEWFFPGGRGRANHLNLAIPEARAYLVEMIGDYIERLDLRWIKWDYNIEPIGFWSAADSTLKVQFGYFEGLYEVLDTLIGKYPALSLEHCASGGRRIDLGILKRSHTLWLSDSYGHPNNPLLSRYFQARANLFLPGHLCLTWISPQHLEGEKEVQNAALLGSMLGHLGFHGDIDSWSGSQVETVAYWVQVYKQIRHLLVQRYYQLLPTPASDEDWDAVQFIDKGSTESVLFVFSGRTSGRRGILAQGLDAGMVYNVKDLVSGGEYRVTGRELLSDGLDVKLGAFGSGLWLISQE